MPALSLLTSLLIIYSVPVIIYAVLFFPELKELVEKGRTRSDVPVQRTICRWRGETDSCSVSLFECLFPMVAAATMALVYSLLAGISWPLGLTLMGALAALAGGVSFTLLRMTSAQR